MMEEYPPVGQTWIFDIGPARIAHSYDSVNSMRYHVVSGEHATAEGRVDITTLAVGEDKFLVTWQEEDKTTVVHYEDFAAGRFESFVTMPDLAFVHFSGRMRRA
jgi:hypothetical protein